MVGELYLSKLLKKKKEIRSEDYWQNKIDEYCWGSDNKKKPLPLKIHMLSTVLSDLPASSPLIFTTNAYILGNFSSFYQ